MGGIQILRNHDNCFVITLQFAQSKPPDKSRRLIIHAITRKLA